MNQCNDCARCDNTGCPQCDPEWAEHQVRISPEEEAHVEAALAKATPMTSPTRDEVQAAVEFLRPKMFNEDDYCVCPHCDHIRTLIAAVVSADAKKP